MNQLDLKNRIKILKCISEGCSLRSTERIAECSINTIVKLTREVGEACHWYHNENVVGVTANRVQIDEIWAFYFCKQKNVHRTKEYNGGDVWTWTAIDAETKLMISFVQGKRDMYTCQEFTDDLYYRIKNRIQLTSDGFAAYPQAVVNTFSEDVDFGQMKKIYGKPIRNGKIDNRVQYLRSEKITVIGEPDEKHMTTAHVERSNLTMRMHMRRYTRATNAYSKKLYNHKLATAFHFVFYNFMRIHSTLNSTPAMRAGLAEKPMTYAQLLKMTDEYFWKKRNLEL